MIFVVHYLEFCADSRALSLIEVRIHKIFNTAVGSLRDPELKFQLKITVLIRRHNVAGTRRFPAVRLLHRQHAIADFPSAFREMVPFRSPPSLGGDRKSTRLNSSHVAISYAVSCLNIEKNMAPTLTST